MQATKSSATMQAHAEVLLARSDRWARGYRNRDGLAFYLFSSSRVDKHGQPIYWRTRRDGAVCDCPSYTYRGACCHAIAVKAAAERAREAVGPRINTSERDTLTNAF